MIIPSYKILVTGTASGLGKYLHENLPGSTALRREDNLESIAKGNVFDCIVHCAFHRCREMLSSDLPKVMEDNLFLTEKLLKIAHKKFIYLSSNTVYPEDKNSTLKENDPIEMEKIPTFPGILKLMNENLVQTRTENYIILRSTSLIGTSMKSNTLTNILFEKHPKVNLTPHSRLNCILYEDAKILILNALKKDIRGLFNFAVSDSVALSEIAMRYGKKVQYGIHEYDPGKIDNQSLTKFFPELDKTSIQNIDTFYQAEIKKAA